MKKKSNIRIGGFAAQNSGAIHNCYSLVRLNVKKKEQTGGFTGDNAGEITKSYSRCKLNNLTGGFVGVETGKSEENCYFLHDEKEGSKKLSRLWDSAKGQRLKEIKEEEDLQNLGFDTEEIWELGGEKTPIQFIPDKWIVDTGPASISGKEELHQPKIKDDAEPSGQDGAALEQGGVAVLEKTREAVVINTADELFELAKKINDGDKELAKEYIQLADNIDLGGKEWIPIGRERTTAFTGLFDGCGYTIKNFVIKDKKVENKGFFGFLKGAVCNLSVDCYIKGGVYSGGIAAQNEGGIIRCCGSIIEMQGKSGNLGGLVGRNAGTIIESYAAGKIGLIIIPWWWGLPVLLLPLIWLLIYFWPSINPFNVPTFAPVPYDKDAIPIGDNLKPNADGNFVAFQFEQYIDVSRETGLCKFNFKNPGNSNHDIVVQLHFTDAQAQRVMGSTGRSAEEQSLIESAGNYDPENYRTVIAESGSIAPGYQLIDLRLTSHANGASVPPGDYNAMVYLIFYDLDTHNRAMLESQLPVVISVHD